MLVFLSVLLIPHTSLAPRLCTASSSLAAVSEAESHAADAYSSTGLVSCCLYLYGGGENITAYEAEDGVTPGCGVVDMGIPVCFCI